MKQGVNSNYRRFLVKIKALLKMHGILKVSLSRSIIHDDKERMFIDIGDKSSALS